MSFQETAERLFGFRKGFRADYRNAMHWTGAQLGQGELKGYQSGLYACFHPHLSLAQLSRPDIFHTYYSRYWVPLDMEGMPVELAVFYLDTALAVGTDNALRLLQDALGMRADGWISPQLRQAWLSEEPSRVALALCARRLKFISSGPAWGDQQLAECLALVEGLESLADIK